MGHGDDTLEVLLKKVHGLTALASSTGSLGLTCTIEIDGKPASTARTQSRLRGNDSTWGEILSVSGYVAGDSLLVAVHNLDGTKGEVLVGHARVDASRLTAKGGFRGSLSLFDSKWQQLEGTYLSMSIQVQHHTLDDDDMVELRQQNQRKGTCKREEEERLKRSESFALRRTKSEATRQARMKRRQRAEQQAKELQAQGKHVEAMEVIAREMQEIEEAAENEADEETEQDEADQDEEVSEEHVVQDVQADLSPVVLFFPTASGVDSSECYCVVSSSTGASHQTPLGSWLLNPICLPAMSDDFALQISVHAKDGAVLGSTTIERQQMEDGFDAKLELTKGAVWVNISCPAEDAEDVPIDAACEEQEIVEEQQERVLMLTAMCAEGLNAQDYTLMAEVDGKPSTRCAEEARRAEDSPLRLCRFRDGDSILLSLTSDKQQVLGTALFTVDTAASFTGKLQLMQPSGISTAALWVKVEPAETSGQPKPIKPDKTPMDAEGLRVMLLPSCGLDSSDCYCVAELSGLWQTAKTESCNWWDEPLYFPEIPKGCELCVELRKLKVEGLQSDLIGTARLHSDQFEAAGYDGLVPVCDRHGVRTASIWVSAKVGPLAVASECCPNKDVSAQEVSQDAVDLVPLAEEAAEVPSAEEAAEVPSADQPAEVASADQPAEVPLEPVPRTSAAATPDPEDLFCEEHDLVVQDLLQGVMIEHQDCASVHDSISSAPVVEVYAPTPPSAHTPSSPLQPTTPEPIEVEVEPQNVPDGPEDTSREACPELPVQDLEDPKAEASARTPEIGNSRGKRKTRKHDASKYGRETCMAPVDDIEQAPYIQEVDSRHAFGPPPPLTKFAGGRLPPNPPTAPRTLGPVERPSPARLLPWINSKENRDLMTNMREMEAIAAASALSPTPLVSLPGQRRTASNSPRRKQHRAAPAGGDAMYQYRHGVIAAGGNVSGRDGKLEFTSGRLPPLMEYSASKGQPLQAELPKLAHEDDLSLWRRRLVDSAMNLARNCDVPVGLLPRSGVISLG